MNAIFTGAVGFSWRFDKGYKPIEIKEGKEVKGDSKAKKVEEVFELADFNKP